MDRLKKDGPARTADAPDDDIDTSEIPERLDWSNAEVGKFYRPVKRQLTLRVDADVLDWFKCGGKGYHTEINRVLRNHMMQNGRPGDFCLASGVWRSRSEPSHRVTLARGQRFPPAREDGDTWVLVAEPA